jgi:hypothetical protein
MPYSFPFLDALLSACHQIHAYIGSDNIGNVYRQLAGMRVGVHQIALAMVCLSPPLSSSLGWLFCFLSTPIDHYHNLDQCPPPAAFRQPMQMMIMTLSNQSINHPTHQ